MILHVSGKHLQTADALSRAPLQNSVDHLDRERAKDIELHVRAVVSAIPASSSHAETYRAAQAEDTVCNSLVSYSTNGWPHKHSLPLHIKPYLKFQSLQTTFMH